MIRRFVLLAVVGIVLGIASVGVVRALDATPSAWQSDGVPLLQKTINLPVNTPPATHNTDCVGMTTKVYLSATSQTDCMVSVPTGHVGANGMIFNGTNESIPVVPPAPFTGLYPVPNQEMLITHTSASVAGLYLHFYKSIRDKLPPIPQFANGRWQLTINKNPDFTLRDSTGKAIAANPFALAFSPNGNWMVVDLPWQGWVRINLATLQQTPFAPSMQQQGDYSDHGAQLAVSNDGMQVVIKPNRSNQFRVYDLQNCTTTTLPVGAGAQPCPYREYLSAVQSQISGLYAIYQPRFVNKNQISFTVMYDYVSGNYKVASYTMTAPGQDPDGINYLGMGDSFASGEGALAYTTETDTNNNRCHLSTKSYPYILSNLLFSSGHSVACSGAIMNDVNDSSLEYKGQVVDKIEKKSRMLESLKAYIANYTPGYLSQSEFIDEYAPEAVSLSIGGNNMGFASIIQNCVSPLTITPTCYPTYEDQVELHQRVSRIFDELVSTYKLALKPGKRVYVIGYPKIVAEGGNCALNVHLNEKEIRMSNDITDYLNATISRAADKAGVRYVDVSDAFAGHRMCEAKSWQVAVNGLTAGRDMGAGPLRVVGSESYHPNELGHTLLAEAIRTKTNNLRLPMPGANTVLESPPLPASLDQRDLLQTGRPINISLSATDMVPDVAIRGQTIPIQLSGTTSLLKPQTVYRVAVGPNNTQIGTITTNTIRDISASIQLPAGTSIGLQQLHLYGPNILGQPLDISQPIYVGSAADDLNGDGVADTNSSCLVTAPLLQDVDKDGIDDGCDGFIAEVPPRKLSGLKSTVTLTQNSITITKPNP